MTINNIRATEDGLTHDSLTECWEHFFINPFTILPYQYQTTLTHTGCRHRPGKYSCSGYNGWFSPIRQRPTTHSSRTKSANAVSSKETAISKTFLTRRRHLR